MQHQQRRLLRNLLIVFCFIGMVFAFYILVGQDKTKLPSQLIDRAVPNFSVVDLLNPELVRTETDFIGKITLLNVWASWCPSCYVEHPYWKEYAKNKDITLVGLNYRDSKPKALKFLNQQGNFFAWNIFDKNGRLGIDFGVYGAPETFIIDKLGKVRYRHVGIVTPEVYEGTMLPLVEMIKQEGK
jgi:cytochrome c biogenesis protein CcmG, thiol:disulfide interchange protein DsbE